MKTAIITGTNGFIGKRLSVKLSALGWNVVELTREAYNVSGDPDGEKLRAIFAKEKPNVVFHLASLFLAQHQSADLPALVESNVLLGTRLLQTISETSLPSPSPNPPRCK